MISLLLLNNFYPVISCRRVQKKKKNDEEEENDELLCTVRSLVMVRESELLTSCAEMTRRVRREFFSSQNCNISSVLIIFNYDPGETNNKFITSQPFLSRGRNNIIPVQRVQKGSDELLCTIRATSCQRKIDHSLARVHCLLITAGRVSELAIKTGGGNV